MAKFSKNLCIKKDKPSYDSLENEGIVRLIEVKSK